METTDSNTLEQWYENGIGSPSTADEVYGYWLFALGIVAAFVGIGLVVLSSSPGQNVRGLGVALAALGLVLLLVGQIIRLPLERTATLLSIGGAAVASLAVVWFGVAFNAGNWGAAFEHSEPIIIGLYGLGILVIGVGSVLTPRLTETGDEQRAAETRAGEAEAERDAAISEIHRQDEQDSQNVTDARAEQTAAEARAGTAEDERDAAIAEITRRDEHDPEQTAAVAATQAHDSEDSQSQFELYKNQDGTWHWRLRHTNGNIIADSNQGYARKHDAQQGIQSVRRDALGAGLLLIEAKADIPDTEDNHEIIFADELESQATFELYEDKGGEYRWRLRHDNGNIIADGREGYMSRNGAESAIEGVREYVGAAEYLQPDPTAIELYEDEAGEYRWRLIHRNGNNLASSAEGYANRSSARRVIDRIREDIADMEIEVYEDEAGGFRWRLAGGDDKVKADSSSYESRDGAEAAVDRVRTFFANADLLDIGHATFELYEDAAGEHRWRLRHRNGNVLAGDGQGYADNSGARDSIESIKRNAPNAGFEEVDS